MHNTTKTSFFMFICFTILFLSTSIVSKPVQAKATLQVSDWAWPLDGDFTVLTNSKYGTTLENTGYAVKNLDLVHSSADHKTCFDVGWHRIYHAGVDLYLRDGSTAGTPVRAVADGVVTFRDDGTMNVSVIINHPQANVYSVYWHLTNIQVTNNATVSMGSIIGYIDAQEYEGRFPGVHPFGDDDSHLHFEIRTFEDGGNIFPQGSPCNTNYPPGVGYTYPESPDEYGYLDPIQFLDDRIPDPPMPTMFYLPTVFTSDACVEGQNLVLYNGGFESAVDYPAPWFEISTYYDPPDTYYYHIVEDDSFLAHAGYNSALFGDQVFLGRIVDEELLQSVFVPLGVDSLEWKQYVKIESPNSYGTDLGDHFIFALKDAETGHSLVEDVIVDYNSVNYPNDTWLNLTITIDNAQALANHNVSLSYSSVTDGDAVVSTLRVDDVRLFGHCGQSTWPLTINRNDPEIMLNWSHLDTGITYEIWHSTVPYFATGDTGAILVDTWLPNAAGGTWLDYINMPPNIGNAIINDFYMLKSYQSPGAMESLSTQVGIFDFAIVPGSP